MINREDIWIVGLLGGLILGAGVQIHSEARELEKIRAANQAASHWAMKERTRGKSKDDERVMLRFISSTDDPSRLEALDWRDRLRYPDWDGSSLREEVDEDEQIVVTCRGFVGEESRQKELK